METIAAYIIFIRGLLAFTLTVGGIYSLNRGFHLITKKLTSDTGEAVFKFGEVEFSAKSVGAIVMMTACLWGTLGYWSLPNMDSSKDGTLRISRKSKEISAEGEIYANYMGALSKCINALNSMDDVNFTRGEAYSRIIAESYHELSIQSQLLSLYLDEDDAKEFLDLADKIIINCFFAWNSLPTRGEEEKERVNILLGELEESKNIIESFLQSRLFTS